VRGPRHVQPAGPRGARPRSGPDNEGPTEQRGGGPQQADAQWNRGGEAHRIVAPIPSSEAVVAALDSWHERAIHSVRVSRLTEVFCELAGEGGVTSLLDIGSGDGRLALAVAERLRAPDLVGVDVLPRAGALIPVLHYDGRRLPFEAQRFDVVTICDVLHHAEHPEAVLREALRVLRPGGRVIVKDHFLFGPWSWLVLLVMDVIGNLPKGALVRARYLSRSAWTALLARVDARAEEIRWPLIIHELPWRLIARSRYQFVACVVPNLKTPAVRK